MFIAYLNEWLNLALRFLHIITGIAWIGASFYFNWLENKLHRQNQRAGIAGSLWAVHGGGYYYLEKYKKYPDNQPSTLHWFKWEAYTTWISGFCLLIVIYYINADTYLLSPFAPISISAAHAVLLSVLGLIIGWLIYDAMCKSRLVDYPVIFMCILFAFVPLIAYLYGLVFSPRAIFMQMGSMIGTIMVANVFFIIMPVQRKLVQACDEKTEISTELGLKGYRRSRHNNYFTLPVLLIMISGHYPHLYSGEHVPFTLMAIFAVAVLIRHVFNLRGEGKSYIRALLLAVIAFSALITLMLPSPQKYVNIDVSFDQVRRIVNKNCVSCHSNQPTQAGFASAPLGFALHTDELIKRGAQLIYQNAVVSRSMPLGNITNMTDEERSIIGDWYAQKIK